MGVYGSQACLLSEISGAGGGLALETNGAVELASEKSVEILLRDIHPELYGGRRDAGCHVGLAFNQACLAMRKANDALDITTHSLSITTRQWQLAGTSHGRNKKIRQYGMKMLKKLQTIRRTNRRGCQRLSDIFCIEKGGTNKSSKVALTRHQRRY